MGTADNYSGFSSNFLNSGGEPFAEWDCIENEVENAPTIDAIPVEWLRMRGKMYKPHINCANPFGYVLAEWLEEQEEKT